MPATLAVMHGHEGIDRVLIAAADIDRRVGELAAEVVAARGPADAGLVIVPILTGAMVFCGDLIRRMPVPMKIGLLAVSSYPGKSTASQGVDLRPGDFDHLRPRVAGRRVVLVDDILDSGNTLRATVNLMRELGAADVRTCVLLRKQDRPEADDAQADYVGFDIPDAFVVGYGLDYDDEYRNLPDICVLKDEVFASVTT